MKRLGFIIVEKAEEYEQPLGIVHGEHFPPGGLLEWTDGPRAVFLKYSDAQKAIARTEYYRLAYGLDKIPEKKYCLIVPLVAAE